MTAEFKLLVRVGLLLVITLGLTTISGLVGQTLGEYIGTNMPDYYRATAMSWRDRDSLDPAQIGQALGLLQGMAVGVILSLIFAAALAWVSYRGRSRSQLELVREELEDLREQVHFLQEELATFKPGAPVSS